VFAHACKLGAEGIVSKARRRRVLVRSLLGVDQSPQPRQHRGAAGATGRDKAGKRRINHWPLLPWRAPDKCCPARVKRSVRLGEFHRAPLVPMWDRARASEATFTRTVDRSTLMRNSEPERVNTFLESKIEWAANAADGSAAEQPSDLKSRRQSASLGFECVCL
jgi:hypothetical protein